MPATGTSERHRQVVVCLLSLVSPPTPRRAGRDEYQLASDYLRSLGSAWGEHQGQLGRL